jgi:hypothetical protein
MGPSLQTWTGPQLASAGAGAPGAFADAAFHSVFEAGVDIFFGHAHFVEYG